MVSPVLPMVPFVLLEWRSDLACPAVSTMVDHLASTMVLMGCLEPGLGLADSSKVPAVWHLVAAAMLRVGLCPARVVQPPPMANSVLAAVLRARLCLPRPTQPTQPQIWPQHLRRLC
jgi:hypothetical protein